MTRKASDRIVHVYESMRRRGKMKIVNISSCGAGNAGVDNDAKRRESADSKLLHFKLWLLGKRVRVHSREIVKTRIACFA